MRHGTDEQETLGKLVLPWSGDLQAGGKLAKTFSELTSIAWLLHLQGNVVWSTWGQRQAEAGQSYGKLLGNSDPQAQSAPEGAPFD